MLENVISSQSISAPHGFEISYYVIQNACNRFFLSRLVDGRHCALDVIVSGAWGH